MANIYYDSTLTAAKIDSALKAIDGVIVPANNGKVLAIENGKIVPKSVTDYVDLNLQAKTATPSASQQTISPDSGYNGLSSVTINGDADLVAGNIKKNVNIFGVVGSYEGGGGGGGAAILSGAAEPTQNQGSNGDIYLKYNNSEIKLLDYIESTSGQWLSTGYIPNQNSKFVMDMELVAPSNSYDTPFGVRSLSDMFVAYNGGTYRYYFGNSNGNVGNISSYYGQRVQMILDKTRAAVEQSGTVLVETAFSASASAMNVPMGIFTLQTGDASDMSACRAKGKLYEFLVYENNSLIRDYVPALDDNNVPCIYELYSGSIHYNLGSGNLGYGTVQSVIETGTINGAYCKVNGVWQNLFGTNISDVNI